MAKSPIGKIVKSLYLEIAYVWTRPYTVLKNEKCAMKAATLKLKKKKSPNLLWHGFTHSDSEYPAKK